MSLNQDEVATSLISEKVEEKQFASRALADLVEKKKKERECELDVIVEEWISLLTKEFVDNKVSDAG